MRLWTNPRWFAKIFLLGFLGILIGMTIWKLYPLDLTLYTLRLQVLIVFFAGFVWQILCKIGYRKTFPNTVVIAGILWGWLSEALNIKLDSALLAKSFIALVGSLCGLAAYHAYRFMRFGRTTNNQRLTRHRSLVKPGSFLFSLQLLPQFPRRLHDR